MGGEKGCGSESGSCRGGGGAEEGEFRAWARGKVVKETSYFAQVSVYGIVIFILFCVVSWHQEKMFFFHYIIFPFVNII